jgi:hypothetical protein
MDAPKAKMIVRCTPTLGAVSVWWARAVENLMWPNNGIKGIDCQIDSRGGEIAEMRNMTVARLLQCETETRELSYFFWVDDDVIPTAGALLQLLSHRRDIVSGVYFLKLPGRLASPLIYPHRLGGADQFVPAPNGGQRSYEVWGHGMGLCLVAGGVYKRMRDELNLPRDKYGNPEWYKTPQTVREDGGIVVEDGVIDQGGTEDLYFLDNAGKLGYRPVVDCSKHAFGFHHDLKTGRCYPEEQWAQLRAGKPIVWETPDGPVTWE